MYQLRHHLGQRFDFVVAGTLKIIRFLRGTISRVHALACIGQGALSRLLRLLELHQLVGHLADLVAAFFETRLCFHRFGTFLLDLQIDAGEFFANRAASRLGLLHGLR